MAKQPQQNPADIAKAASKLGELKARFLFLIGALIVFPIGTYIPGTNPDGKQVSENRLQELRADGTVSEPVKVPMVWSW